MALSSDKTMALPGTGSMPLYFISLIISEFGGEGINEAIYSSLRSPFSLSPCRYYKTIKLIRIGIG